MRQICFLIVASLTAASLATASPRAGEVGKKRYSCVETLPPAQPGGKVRKLDWDVPYSDGYPLEWLLPDSGDDTTNMWWDMTPYDPPFGIRCIYNDKSEVDLPIPPTVRRCFETAKTSLHCE